MTSDFAIGRVIGVDTIQISVELNQHPLGVSRSTYEGIQEVGLIGSYIVIPKGSSRLVGIVTRIVAEETNIKRPEDELVAVPVSIQTMNAVLIGTIKDGEFSQGVSTFPLIDTNVNLTTREDLDLIFGVSTNEKSLSSQKFTIPIGESAIFSERPILIDPDAFFGKHAAILGSTGSGKSCTIAAIIQSILEQPEIKQTTFIILDTNGEYKAAFYGDKTNENYQQNRCQYISSGPNQSNDGLSIPYWFMNSEDFVRMFRASPGVQRPILFEALRLARNDLQSIYSIKNNDNLEVSADAPSHFDIRRFRLNHLENLLKPDGPWGGGARSNSGTMLLRIDRLLADQRFDFLFGEAKNGTEKGRLEEAEHILAAFIRDIVGIGSAQDYVSLLSGENNVPTAKFPFYDRQRNGSGAVNIVIIDLSLLASEVLENVTALIGRLILEFLQRLGEYDGGKLRGSLPVVLVLEEAQNYINQYYSGEDESISRLVYERIAREGRKYGLSLVVASQRPSELSKTVLSQCNSFVVHRLQNPDDLRYFKQIVPSIYEPMLNQLPALAPQRALVLGECVPAPVLAKIREADPIPLCRDPKFYDYWVAEEPADVPVEEICAIWEGKQIDDPIADPAESQE